MDDDGTITIIKTMIKANEGLPNVWARLLESKIETLQERCRRFEGEKEALQSQLNSSMFYLVIFISCFICFIYLLLFFFSFSKRC